MMKMQPSGFLHLFLLALIGFSANRCTNGADPEIFPVDEGYKPDHAIEFSHDLHAGKLKIDCTYCHNPEIDGKKEGIPVANVCLKCHKQVKGNSSGEKKVD